MHLKLPFLVAIAINSMVFHSAKSAENLLGLGGKSIVEKNKDAKIAYVKLDKQDYRDDVIKDISEKINLLVLDVSSTETSDRDLQFISILKNLKHLTLRGTQVTDAGLQHLAGLAGLEKLDLGGTRVTDAGLQHLAGLPRIKYLSLAGTQVTDAGLQYLAGLNNLQSLSLRNTQITQKHIDLIINKRLRYINLKNTNISFQCLNNLIKENPSLKIDF